MRHGCIPVLRGKFDLTGIAGGEEVGGSVKNPAQKG